MSAPARAQSVTWMGVAHAGGNDLSLDIGIVEEHIVDRLDQLDARLAEYRQDGPGRG